MWIPSRVNKLSPYDIGDLVATVSALSDDDWRRGQSIKDQLAPYRETQSIYLCSIANDAFERLMAEGQFAAGDVEYFDVGGRLAKQILRAVDAAVSHFEAGGVVTRVQLAKLPAGAEILPHRDLSAVLRCCHRIHLPLITHSQISFVVDGEPQVLEAGTFYELNNRARHSVSNRGDRDRVHLIVDYLPPSLWHSDAVEPGYEKRRKHRWLNEHEPATSIPESLNLPDVIVSSVVRGADKSESHGGLFLVELQTGRHQQIFDYDRSGISFEGRGWDRGLRGIVVVQDGFFVAASDELYRFNLDFEITGAWRNRYLRHCHEITRLNNFIILTSTGFDSLLVFDAKSERFTRGWYLRKRKEDGALIVSEFDPTSNHGPATSNQLHLNSVTVDADGRIFVTGRNLRRLISISDERQSSQPLPPGTHNAMKFRDGYLYNDTVSDLVVFESETAFCYFEVPRYDASALRNTQLGDNKLARQAFARGLCPVNDDLILAGSSPTTVSAYHLPSRSLVTSVNLTMDIRNAVHGLEVWPFGLP